MTQTFSGWQEVAACLESRATGAAEKRLNRGQRATLRAIAKRVEDNGVLVADEVGMGKTRIAVEVALCVTECGGRVAIVVPPGLGYQWQTELREGAAARGSGSADPPEFLRSLWGFLAAWSSAEEAENRAWFKQPIVLVSHAFTNWRLGVNSDPWRWGLLPELYARARKAMDGRLPRGYRNNDKLSRERVERAAKAICDAVVTNGESCALRTLEKLKNETPWPGALDAAEYSRNNSLRPWLEKAVGLGLGTFDLVIIDEAHKSRGTETRLSGLLENVIQQNERARRLGMTATPVELDASQWGETLRRVDPNVDLHDLKPVIDSYADCARRIRVAWRTSEEARREYAAAAEAFQLALSRYVLRRDKREDPAIKRFAELSGCREQEYREELEIAIESTNLSSPWKHIVCAAEALSVTTRQADDSTMKRLRLTVGNGHGVAALMDQVQHDEADEKQVEYDATLRDASDAPRSKVSPIPRGKVAHGGGAASS